MRVIVHGIGAIGGTVAATLALAGHEVVGIARGAQLAAIRAQGMVVRTPDRVLSARFDCVADPSEITFRPDDAILLTVKSQQTEAALDQLARAGVTHQPLFCAQNGVANERRALRRFPNVHGVTVMMPADYLTAGEAVCYGIPRHGIFDIGCYPGGTDAADTALAAVLDTAGIAAFADPSVMESKYGKLLMNLQNIVETAIGPGEAARRLHALLEAEAKTVLTAAGIAWRDVGASDPRRAELMRMGKVAGVQRAGSSTAQSLARQTGSLETDFLNGEIALLGRLHGVPAPLNTGALRLAARLLREGLAPGALPVSEVEAMLGIQPA